MRILKPVTPIEQAGPRPAQAVDGLGVGKPSRTPRSRADTVSARTGPLLDVSAFVAALDKNQIYRLRDSQVAQGVSQLLRHVGVSGFFENRYQGMQRISDDNSSLEVQLSPNRKAKGSDRSSRDSSVCVLCVAGDDRSRRVRWRDYDLLPNKYPYVGAQSEHMLIMPTAHRPQSFSASLLADMIDYQRAASSERPVTMHYNGLAGNSQSHLHWQSTHEILPIQNELESGRLKTTLIRQSPQGKLESFEDGLYAGFALTGSKDYVLRFATQIVARLDRDPRTSAVNKDGKRQGTYNMLMLPRADGQVRLIIQPRRADKLKVEIGSAGRVGVGAFTLGGVFVLVRDQVPHDFFEKVQKSVKPTIVSPSELGWTRVLKQLPESSAIQIRATR